jgi:hypothetical protein
MNLCVSRRPNGHTKDSCSGWVTTARYNVTEFKAGIAAGEKNLLFCLCEVIGTIGSIIRPMSD